MLSNIKNNKETKIWFFKFLSKVTELIPGRCKSLETAHYLWQNETTLTLKHMSAVEY